ncbi:MAG: hypothetical protein DHS20C14_07690 [Phycisphaeraceae bacterium]|nr:MAG: hypothetical protein DHS20C14_07690 [Phycisphaeraceae bacterium]
MYYIVDENRYAIEFTDNSGYQRWVTYKSPGVAEKLRVLADHGPIEFGDSQQIPGWIGWPPEANEVGQCVSHAYGAFLPTMSWQFFHLGDRAASTRLVGGIEVGGSGHHLPLNINPFPFAVESLLFSILTWGSMTGFAYTRARLRIRRGRCPRCAYDLAGDLSPGCPECGWNRVPA